jgi:hypothetical protein
MVRHDAHVATAERPNTKEFSERRRKDLGLIVIRTREAAGHQWRPSFAKSARVGLRSLVKLENGDPVGPTIYEAVARAFGWPEDSVVRYLETGDESVFVLDNGSAARRRGPAEQREEIMRALFAAVVQKHPELLDTIREEWTATLKRTLDAVPDERLSDLLDTSE